MTLAEAALPAPLSLDVTALVVLFLTPAVVPVTLIVKVQVAFAANVAPARLADPDPAVAVIVPPPQEPVSPFAVATVRPAGIVSVNPTPVNGVLLGLVMVNVRLVLPPTATLAAPNALTMVGVFATVMLAEAVLPAPPSLDVTALVVLFLTHAVVPVTLIVKVQDAFAASAAPTKLADPDPAVAVIVPPPQEPVSPFAVATVRPAGIVSVNPTPVSGVLLGLVMVNARLVLPPTATLAAPKALTMAGALTTVMLAEAVPPVTGFP